MKRNIINAYSLMTLSDSTDGDRTISSVEDIIKERRINEELKYFFTKNRGYNHGKD